MGGGDGTLGYCFLLDCSDRFEAMDCYDAFFLREWIVSLFLIDLSDFVSLFLMEAGLTGYD